MSDEFDPFTNPWTSKENTKHEDPVDRRVSELQAREQIINALPAGSLSAGQVIYDPEDIATHYLSPSKAERDFAKEFFGVYAPEDPDNPIPGRTPRDGISRAEKKILHKAADLEVNGGFRQIYDQNGYPIEGPAGAVHVDGIDFAQQDKDDRALTKELAALWPEFAMRHSELAQDQASVAAAIRGLMATSGLSRRELVALARSEQRTEILDRIAQETYNVQLTGRGGSRAQPRGGYEEDNRTSGISTGSSGGGNYSAKRDAERPQSMFSELEARQRKFGWTS